MPGSVDLQLATLASQPPSGEEWLSEIKLDGYRIACHIAEGKARLYSRQQQDCTARFAAVASAGRVSATSASERFITHLVWEFEIRKPGANRMRHAGDCNGMKRARQMTFRQSVPDMAASRQPSIELTRRRDIDAFPKLLNYRLWIPGPDSRN